MAFKEIVERYQTKVFHNLRHPSNRMTRRISRSRFCRSTFRSKFRLSQLAADVDLQDHVNECYDYLRKKRYASCLRERFRAEIRCGWKIPSRPPIMSTSRQTVGAARLIFKLPLKFGRRPSLIP